MRANERKNRLTAAEERCDVKVWSGECMNADVSEEGEKYLCNVCGQIAALNHEVRHDTFPYLSGDKDFLS